MVGNRLVPRYGWTKFEWDDEEKKNGNIQHLRDHGIEPEEAEECFFTNIDFTGTSVVLAMFTFWMV